MRKMQEAHMSTGTGPEVIDMMVDSVVEQRCTGTDGTERDRYIFATRRVQRARRARACGVLQDPHADRDDAHVEGYQPDDRNAMVGGGAQSLREWAAACSLKAGDCPQAWAVFRDLSAKLVASKVITGSYDAKADFGGLRGLRGRGRVARASSGAARGRGRALAPRVAPWYTYAARENI